MDVKIYTIYNKNIMMNKAIVSRGMQWVNASTRKQVIAAADITNRAAAGYSMRGGSKLQCTIRWIELIDRSD